MLPRLPALVMALVVVVLLWLQTGKTMERALLAHAIAQILHKRIAKTNTRYLHSEQMFRYIEIILILFVLLFFPLTLFYYICPKTRLFCNTVVV